MMVLFEKHYIGNIMDRALRLKVAELLDMTEVTTRRHENAERPYIRFFEKYFTAADLDEFISSGKISRFEDTIVAIHKADNKEFNADEKFDKDRKLPPFVHKFGGAYLNAISNGKQDEFEEATMRAAFSVLF